MTVALCRCRSCKNWFWFDSKTSDSEVADSLPLLCYNCDGNPISDKPYSVEPARENSTRKPYDLTDSDLERLKKIQKDANAKKVKILKQADKRVAKSDKKRKKD